MTDPALPISEQRVRRPSRRDVLSAALRGAALAAVGAGLSGCAEGSPIVLTDSTRDERRRFAQQWPKWAPHPLGEYRFQFLWNKDLKKYVTHVELMLEKPSPEKSPFIRIVGSDQKFDMAVTDPDIPKKWCGMIPAVPNPMTWRIKDSDNVFVADGLESPPSEQLPIGPPGTLSVPGDIRQTYNGPSID